MRFTTFVTYTFLFCILSVFSVDAQNSISRRNDPNYQLAYQHYNKGEFDKALIYFQKLYANSPSQTYYDFLMKCYIEVEDFKKAEKLIRKRIKKYPKQPGYIFDLGYLYMVMNRDEDGKQQFEKAIQSLSSSQSEVIALATKFRAINELDYAEKTYLRGKKKVKSYPFNFELAQIYYQKQDVPAMIREYLDLLELNDGYAQSVQNALQTALNPDPGSKRKDHLRTELLKRIQKKPDAIVFSEMLIWLYIQEKDFGGALLQAKALDKRNNESGNRIMAIAKLSRSNQDYNTAIEGYEYVIAKGKDGFRYQPAKMALVEVLNEKIVNSSYTQEDLIQLEDLYLRTLQELGERHTTLTLIRGLARLQAFYLDKSESAIALLNKAISLPQIKIQAQAECKIELADVYLTTDEIWEASLLYSQVEKAFKYDRLGETAKFKNAKVFYYSGDFKWSKAQLDVLKGSTSKLIANDAMELSLLITDNTTIDTTTVPLLKFAHADLLLVQNKEDEALEVLDSIEYLFPVHSLKDEILYKKYEIFRKKQDYEKAASYLQSIYDYDASDILADNALFHLARLYETHLEDKERAMKLYKNLLDHHSDSIYVTEARKRFRALRGDSIN